MLKAALPFLLLLLCAACAPAGDDDDSAGATPFLAVTFNTGTTPGMGHDQGPDDGYTQEHADRSDRWYGDGLAWVPAVEAATAWFADLQPDVVVFQEIFHPDDCADVPDDARADFVCEDWQPGDPTVAQRILGPGYQVACHPGKPDKCAAVRSAFGRFEGCSGDLCLEGMDGFTVPTCGSGARVARGVIALADGGELTLVNVHGSSGLSGEDKACRVAQVEQVFVDLGDGAPGTSGERNLVLGDFNTDPGRWLESDVSAARWRDFAAPSGEGDGSQAFTFHTDVGPDATTTYSGLANIDHALSDFAEGGCWHAGVTDGRPAVTDARYFDHVPAVCSLRP